MISGFFDSQYRFPYVWVRLSIVGGPADRLVPFVIDTGASTTVVHAHDALHHLGLSEKELEPKTWEPSEWRLTSGIGGITVCRMVEASYAFTVEGGSREVITGAVELGSRDSEELPSLLGWDVLRHFRLDLNASRGTVSLLPT